MFTKSQRVLATLTFLAVCHDIKTQIEATKAAKLYLAAVKAYEETQQANEAQIEYLCHMLDENDIDADAFDLIVLNYNQ